MAPLNSQKWPQNVSQLKEKIAKQDNTPKTIAKSGSNWGETELVVCRVLQKPAGKKHLPILTKHITAARKRLESETQLSGFLGFLEGVTKDDLQNDLTDFWEMGGIFGSFYTRLAEVVQIQDMADQRDGDEKDTSTSADGNEDKEAVAQKKDGVQGSPFKNGLHEDEDEDEEGVSEEQDGVHGNPSKNRHRPTRKRTLSLKAQEAKAMPSFSQSEASSSQKQGRRSPVSQGSTYTDREKLMASTKHETSTITMITELMSIVLGKCADQKKEPSRIRYWSSPTRRRLQTAKATCECYDDGSFVSRQSISKDPKANAWGPPYALALIEAKAQFECWREDTDKGIVVSKVLAQQVCEMLSLASERVDVDDLYNMTWKNRQIILISVHHSTITFRSFELTEAYIKYFFKGDSAEEGKKSTEDGKKSAKKGKRSANKGKKSLKADDCLNVLSSRNFNLEKGTDRIEVVIAIMALVDFWNAEDSEKNEDRVSC